MTASLPPGDGFDPTEAFPTISAAILDLVGAVASEALLVIAIDDAHWLDDASTEIVAMLSEHAGSAPWLLLCLSREFRASLRNGSAAETVVHIRIGPLSDTAARAVLRNLPSSPPNSAAGDTIIARAAGNPLFLHMLATHTASATDRDAYPRALAELVRSRIERVSDDERAILEVAVLLERHATSLRLQATLRATPLQIVEAARTLEQAGLLCFHDGVVSVRHPLVSSLVAEAMPDTVRAVLHGRVARLLQRESRRSRNASLLWDVADHWERAGDADRAAESFRACVHHSLRIGRPQDVVALVERCLALRGCSPHVRTDSLQLAAATFDLLGEWKRAADLAADSLKLESGAAAPDTAYLFRMSSRHATGYRDTTGREKAAAILRDFRANGSAKLLAASVLVAYAEDEFEPHLAELAKEAVCAVGEVAGRDWHQDRFWLIYHTCFGSITAAGALARSLASRELEGPIAGDALNRCFNLAYALVRTGEPTLAKELLDAADKAAERFSLPMQRLWCLCWQAWIACQEGEWDTASRYSDAAGGLALSDSLSTPPMHSLNRIEIAFERGDLESIERSLSELESGMPRQKCARLSLHIDQLRARLALAAGNVVEDTEIARLLDGHKKGRTCGLHDDVVATISESLRAAGRANEARFLVDRYLQDGRRDPFPISVRLRKAAVRELSGAQAG